MSKLKILLLAGHGDGDCGAVGCGYKEADLTRELVKLINPKLSKVARVTVFDINKNPYEYFKKYSFNFRVYDYVFEVHLNACVKDYKGNGKTTGTEIYVHPKEMEEGTSVEEAILRNISALGFKNRGVNPRSNLQNMNICKGSQGVSYALLETCFIDDQDDMILYEKTKDKIAKAIVDGIAEGFGIKEETQMAGFKDIKGHYAESSINDLFNMGIVKGDGAGNFRPDDYIKRGDAAIMIRNAIKFITGK